MKTYFSTIIRGCKALNSNLTKQFKFIFLAFCLSLCTAFAQTSTQNYVQGITPLLEVKDQSALNGLNDFQKRSVVTYYDGLGRPIQQVGYRQSPTFKDIVQINEYDINGRQSKQYLPFQSVNLNGAFVGTANEDQEDFYLNTARVARSAYPYSETVFENSPRNRVVEQSAPGEDWKLGSGHTLKTYLLTNTANEVRLWKEDQSTGNVTSIAFYNAEELSVIQTIDEHGYSTYTYTDKKGQTVLKKVQYQSSPALYTQTHYVYNYLGQLVCVIPPKAYQDMATMDVDAEVADRVYRYKYDYKSRLTEKKIPHKGWEYLVYDLLDRPILTQDAKQRAGGQWSFMKHDALGRMVETGFYYSSSSRSSVQATANTAAYTFEEPTDNLSNYGTEHAYTNRAFPNTAIEILTVNYYDDYDFDQDGTDDYSFILPPAEYAVTSASTRTQSLTTGAKVKILDNTNTFLTTTNWYDEKARLIQTQSNNHMGGSELTHNAYNFANELTRTTHIHANGSGTTVTLNQRMVYDHAGRLKQVYHQVDNQAEVLYCDNVYNALGQLVDKKLHSTRLTSPRFLQSIDFAYNIRGWLTHINNADLDDDQYISTSVAPGTILGFEVEQIDFIVNEVDDEQLGRYLELQMGDVSDMIVSGNVDNEIYENDGAALLFLMDYPGEEGGADLTLYNALLNGEGTPFEMAYEPALAIHNETDIETLQQDIYADVETALEGSDISDEGAIAQLQSAVFNYVSGKVSHVLEVYIAPFSSEYLQYYFGEQNGHQLYMTVWDATQTQTHEVFIMNKTQDNLSEYDDLLALTNQEGQAFTLVVDFSLANLYEGMSTLDAINECKSFQNGVMSGHCISNTTVLDEMEKFATNYALHQYGNVFSNNDANDLWGMELKYNSSTNTAQGYPFGNNALYNGNISEMLWQGAGDNQKRAYAYQYDGLNRLSSANYKAYNGATESWSEENNRYSIPQISYDVNGNILSLERNGFISGNINQNAAFGLMDDLSYSYTGDQLTQVSDAATHYQNDFKDGTNSGNDYTYDVNGNLLSDANKDISITYNHLNLPKMVSNSQNQSISYIYDATGVKLQKVYNNNGTSTTTDYTAIGNYQSQGAGNPVLDFVFTSEGRLVEDNGTFRYEYFYKDHLGNTRLTFSDYNNNEEVVAAEIGQQENYYPFGLTHQGTYYGTATQTDHKYLFNGKEKQDELGIGWYDYGARNYDAAVGRWFNVDPLAELYNAYSPYNYTLNHPTKFVDPDGRGVICPTCPSGSEYDEFRDSDINYEYTANEDGTREIHVSDHQYLAEATTIAMDPNPDPSTIRNIYDDPAPADDKGFIRTENGEVSTWVLNNLSPVGALDDFIATYNDEEATTHDKVNATMAVILAGAGGKGRGKYKLSPSTEATGSHTTFRRGDNGKVYKYQTYEKTSSGHYDPVLRYDAGHPDGRPGAPHTNKLTKEKIPTPHVQSKKIPGGVRPANPDEIPK
jgi:RHS repeat-associated protein